jgi:hypothetical protein
MNVTFPKLKWPWTEDQYKALQKWIDQVRDVFQGRISYATNLNSDVVDIDFTAGSIPMKKTTLTSRPLGVLLLGVVQTSPSENDPPIMPEGFGWTFDDGSIFLTSLGSITGTAKYRASVLVIKG